MERRSRADLILGLAIIALALLTAFVWVPLDSGSGLIEKVRRQVTIGDALAPTVASVFLLLGGSMVAFTASRTDQTPGLSLQNLRFVAALLGLLFVTFLIMRWAGPAVAGLFVEGGYRPLRATAPWKYIGFVIGGTVMVAGLVAFVERRLSLRGVVLGLLAALLLIAIYDLPFDDLLLPPNGDV